MLLALVAIGIIGSPTTSTAQKSNQDGKEFRYLIDEFADVKVMRYQVPGWEGLSLDQKAYIYYLSEAAKSGRDIFWDQNYKYNLTIRRTLENILNTYSGKRNTEDWNKFILYAKRVFFSNGIHHHYAENKILPEFSKEYFNDLINKSDQKGFPVDRGESVKDFASRIGKIILDASIAPMKQETDKDKDIIANSSVNFYENLTRKEVDEYYGKMKSPDPERPWSIGINSKLKKEKGRIEEITYTEKGMYGKAISEIISWLEKANSVAENDVQRNYTKLLIDYYKTGDLQTWDDYNVAWVQDNESIVDYINGFIENYGDPLGMKSTWESVVNFKDVEATKRTEIISENAQWFEDNSPIDPRFKKKEVKGVSAKVINAVMLGGDCYPTPPIGINLPNADWIRKEYGSKSVTIANISSAYEKAALESPKGALQEFAENQEEINRSIKYGGLAGDLHTDLHECLGHGSGQLLPGTSPSALADNSSSLEEARADLFALYYILDPKMEEIGLVPSKEVGMAEYDAYIRNGLMVQYARIEFGKDVNQAHMQARKLISTYAYERGMEAKVIEKVVRNNKTYFRINDHQALRKIFGELLATIQTIKSTGDYDAGKKLIDTYAVKIDPRIHREVLERYKELNIKPYGGFVNPEITPITNNRGQVIDYQVSYPDDFLKQQLEYGKKYSFLPHIN